MVVSLLAGVAMIAWGVASRGTDFAPLKWIIGLLCLVAIPLENCLVKGRRTGGDTS